AVLRVDAVPTSPARLSRRRSPVRTPSPPPPRRRSPWPPPRRRRPWRCAPCAGGNCLAAGCGYRRTAAGRRPRNPRYCAGTSVRSPLPTHAGARVSQGGCFGGKMANGGIRPPAGRSAAEDAPAAVAQVLAGDRIPRTVIGPAPGHAGRVAAGRGVAVAPVDQIRPAPGAVPGLGPAVSVIRPVTVTVAVAVAMAVAPGPVVT